MANWKVSKEKIEIFPHLNAEKLEIGKVGDYQLVVQKGLYVDGQEVVCIPRGSLLSGQIREEFEKYLGGREKNLVKSVKLRGETSECIIYPPFMLPDISQYAIGDDISEILNIQKFEPPIPQNLAGKVAQLSIDKHIGHHDCEQFRLYESQFLDNEEIVASIKYHGSQVIIAYDFDTDKTMISSKGQLKKGLEILEEEGNTYWRAFHNDNLLEKIKKHFSSGVIQLFGEVLPVQSFKYGLDPNKPTIMLFDIRQNGIPIPYDQIPKDFQWVKILYAGKLAMDKEVRVLYEGDPETGEGRVEKTFYHFPQWLIDLGNAKENNGMERHSGKSLHIEEGIVVHPKIHRFANDNRTLLRLKIISDKYAKTETGDEIN